MKVLWQCILQVGSMAFGTDAQKLPFSLVVNVILRSCDRNLPGNSKEKNPHHVETFQESRISSNSVSFNQSHSKNQLKCHKLSRFLSNWLDFHVSSNQTVDFLLLPPRLQRLSGVDSTHGQSQSMPRRTCLEAKSLGIFMDGSEKLGE